MSVIEMSFYPDKRDYGRDKVWSAGESYVNEQSFPDDKTIQTIMQLCSKCIPHRSSPRRRALAEHFVRSECPTVEEAS